MKTKTLNKIILSAIVLIAVLVFNFIFLLRTNTNYDEIIENKKNIITESSQTNSLSDTKNKIQDLEMIRSRIDSVLINEENAVAFISLIENLANESGVQMEIQNIDFADPEEEGQLGVLDMTFRIVGSWSNTTNFLGAVESLPYLVNVGSIRLSLLGQTQNGDGENLSNQWSIDFHLIGLTN